MSDWYRPSPDTVDWLKSLDRERGASLWPISPLEGEMPGRAEGGAAAGETPSVLATHRNAEKTKRRATARPTMLQEEHP
jgi:hypothetical protein